MSLPDALTLHGYPLKDPDAPCDACGHVGTVGRALKFEDGVEVFHVRYCAECWVEESARVSARWTEAAQKSQDDFLSTGSRRSSGPSIATAMGAATWHGIRDFLQYHVMPSLESEQPPDRRYLAELADAYRAIAPQLVGRAPHLVEQFIAKYAS